MSKRPGNKPSGSKPDERAKLNRRRFFMLGGSVAAAAAVPLAAEAQTSETDAEKKKARYRETDHVKTFYRVNRY
jgi:ABC-type oligopeptide transport system substrate-binding subunit